MPRKNTKSSYTSHLHDSKSGYAKYAQAYDQTAKHLNSFEKNIIPSLVPDLDNKHLVDLGAGTGRIFDILKQRELIKPSTNLTAIDLSPEMLEQLTKKHPQAEAIEANIESIPLPDESADVVTAAFVIVHLKFLDKAFAEIARILKPGGTLILTNINQRKAPKLKTPQGEEIVIKSHYHIPKHVIQALEYEFFTITNEEFTYEPGVKDQEIWVNQIIKAIK
jgi:ubiquinone/menaquinone biosynthesis C-methylase UbiE